MEDEIRYVLLNEKREEDIINSVCKQTHVQVNMCSASLLSRVWLLWLSVHGDSPGKNTEVGCLALLQGIFSTQGSNPVLPHCRRILYCLSHQGSPQVYMDYVNIWYLGECSMYNVNYFYICMHSVDNIYHRHLSLYIQLYVFTITCTESAGKTGIRLLTVTFPEKETEVRGGGEFQYLFVMLPVVWGSF